MALTPPPVGTTQLFMELVGIPSPSGAEGEIISAIEGWLSGIGVSSSTDCAFEITGSEVGNLIARLPSVGERVMPTVLLVAHVDTVQKPEESVLAEVGKDNVIRSAGATILGADNKSAVAAILQLLASPRDCYPTIIAAFTTSEEAGMMGVTALRDVAAECDLAFSIDGSYPIGTIFTRALGQVPFEVQIKGREAHASRCPNDGIHALKAASLVVSQLDLGWLGEEFINIGEIKGGTESNIIPAEVEIVGEVRGYSAKAMSSALERVDKACHEVAAETGIQFEFVPKPEVGAPAFDARDEAVLRSVVSLAAEKGEIDLRYVECRATLEVNFLQAMGIPTLGIASGGEAPHTSHESISVGELDRLVVFLDQILYEVGKADLQEA